VKCDHQSDSLQFTYQNQSTNVEKVYFEFISPTVEIVFSVLESIQNVIERLCKFIYSDKMPPAFYDTLMVALLGVPINIFSQRLHRNA